MSGLVLVAITLLAGVGVFLFVLGTRYRARPRLCDLRESVQRAERERFRRG